MPPKPFIVGITGGSASGKTLFLKKLRSMLPSEITIISQDDYYHPKEKQPLDKNGIENFDTPFSIDLDGFLADLKKLSSGKEVTRMEYTFNNPSKTPEMLVFKPSRVIIVEGIFLLSHPEIANILDLKIFIDAPEHLKLERRIHRDKVERGYDLNDVMYRYENHVTPNYDQFIKPYRDHSDIIVPNVEGFEKGLEVIVEFLKTKT